MCVNKDVTTDLSSADDSTLEMNQSECEQLWDLLAILKTLWIREFEQKVNHETHNRDRHNPNKTNIFWSQASS